MFQRASARRSGTKMPISTRRHAQLRGRHGETAWPVKHEGEQQYTERKLTILSPPLRADLDFPLKSIARPVPEELDWPAAFQKVRIGEP